MKLVKIVFQFQYAEDIEALLDARGVGRWVRVPMVHGRDRDGKHQGSQAFPGNVTMVEAQVPDEEVDALFDALARFRDERAAHAHVEAFALSIERRLTEAAEDRPGGGDGAGGDA